MLKRKNLKRVLLPLRAIRPRKKRRLGMPQRLMLLPRKRKALRRVNQRKNLRMKMMTLKTKPRTRMTILQRKKHQSK